MANSLLTAKQAQEILNVDRTTIYRMLKDGRLHGVKVGQQWRFYKNEVDTLLAGARRPGETETPVGVEVLPLHCMQPVQDVFAEIAEVGAVTTARDGQPLTRISNSCDFCKLILGSEKGRQDCIRSWRGLAEQEEESPEFVSCHAGLQYARACIEVNGTLIAMLIAGQFYLEPPDLAEEMQRIKRLSRAYSIDDDLLSQAASRIKVLDERKVSQLCHWLEEVAHTFEEISSERADLMGRLHQISVMTEFD